MYLKELTINGFKSFAKKSDLEFSAPITAIVGPNGSGKSNVAESFRFVLGEQSVKSLRGKKGEDLIWGGTEKVGRGNRATVVVEFDNSSRTLALDFDEVKIADKGIGIPLSCQNNIFTKFYRASNANKKYHKGLGISLFLIKNIANDWGGGVNFISNESGSIFSLKILCQKK